MRNKKVEENDSNEKKFSIRELFVNKQKRSILVLGFYFVLFICLIISVNNSNASSKKNSNKSNNNMSDKINNDSSLENINISNYEFTYDIIKDGKNYVYKGKNYGSKQLFSIDKTDYYKSLNTYLKKDKDSWSLTNSPYIYEEYIDFNNLNNILKKSNFISTNTYNDGVVFNSYYMFVDGIVSKNIMNLYSKDNHLIKVEISLTNGDSITINLNNINGVKDFEIK